MHNRIRNSALAVFLLLAGSKAVLARECQDRDFLGPYVVLVGGDIINVAPFFTLPAGPFSRLALLIADGKGKVTVPFAQGNYFGVIFAEPFTGIFSVRPDCLVQFRFVVPPPVQSSLPFTGVLYDHNSTVEMILSGFGVAIHGSQTRQQVAGCRLSDFKGAFEISMSGVVLNTPAGFPFPGYTQPAPPFPLGDFVRVGKFQSDGAGGFTMDVVTSYNGTNLDGTIPMVLEQITGTYTMDSSLCKVALSYKLNPANPTSPTIVVDGLMIDHDRLALMFLTPGTNIRGTMNRQ
jgi:hypothetical protein